MKREVYHWTHESNLGSIITHGVDPSFSEGKLLASWFCGPSRLGWALCHVANRHGWDPDEMICLRIEVDSSTLKRTCNTGVWTRTVATLPGDLKAVRFHQWEGFRPFEQTPADTQRPGK